MRERRPCTLLVATNDESGTQHYKWMVSTVLSPSAVICTVQYCTELYSQSIAD